MIKAGIIGVTGYAGAELARLLLDHPNVTITAASSVTYEGQPLAAVYPSYHQFTDVICTDEDEVIDKSDVIFAALPAGLSQSIAKKALAAGKSCGLRVNPNHSTQDGGIYDPCAPGSRLGILKKDFLGKNLRGIEGLHFHTLCEQGFDALQETQIGRAHV